MWKWGFLFVSLLLFACSGTQNPIEPVATPSECGDCEYLLEGVCVAHACCANTDCSADQVCIGNECKNLVCGECQYAEGHACLDHECCNDAACGTGSRCFENVCEAITCAGCAYLDGNECKPYDCCENAHCDDGDDQTFDVCSNNVCKHHDVNECRDDDGICPVGCNFIADNDCGDLCKGISCSEGEVCVDGECQLPSCASFGGVLCGLGGDYCLGDSEESSSGQCCLGECVICIEDSHCDDSRDDTDDFCLNNRCVYTEN